MSQLQHVDSDFMTIRKDSDIRGYGIYVHKYRSDEMELYGLTLMIEEQPQSDFVAFRDHDDLIANTSCVERFEDENWECAKLDGCYYVNEITQTECHANIYILEQKSPINKTDFTQLLNQTIPSLIEDVRTGYFS
ncbi:hypothetical protein [Photobacterium leiognathi]|uniref:hypothetical protein n=1 Tax=Photobacterium leiognathi TaxID=553611 RepID=UPI002982B372|nr:hypothetical protein [Photobacterium leiognathi]